MNDRVISIKDLDRAELLRHSAPVLTSERQCRVSLAADWREGQPDMLRIVQLRWNPGGPNGRDTLKLLRPGKSLTMPLWQAQSYFGPFALNFDYAMAESEAARERIKAAYEHEKHRILNQYGYPLPLSKSRDGMEPIGPHRFPDITVSVIEDDGTEQPEIRLHELYEIGAWDKTYPLDSFGVKETPAQVEARMASELAAKDAQHAAELTGRDKQFAELSGMVKGLAVAVAGKKNEKDAVAP